MRKQETSVLTDLHKNPVSPGQKLSSQGKFTMSCRAFCCCVFFTGAVLSFILSTILLFGVENYHKVDPVKIYEVFQTPKYALTNQLLDNTKYLILYGSAASGIINFIEHEANLRVIEGKPVVIRQLDQNIIKKHMKETKHFVEMYLGQVGRGHHSWFILLNDTETPTHEITSLQTKYPHDTIVILTPKKLEMEGFTSHQFPPLKAKQLKDFMQKDLDMDKKQIKQIFDQSASKDIPDIFVSYKNHEQAKIRAAEQAERLKKQQQEEQRKLKQQQEKRKQIEAQRAAEQHNQQDEQAQPKSKKTSKKSKGKTPKSKKQTKVEKPEQVKVQEEQEEVKQTSRPKKSEKKSKSETKGDKKSNKKSTKKSQTQKVQKEDETKTEQNAQQVPIIDVEEVKVSQEPKKVKGKKNKKVKENIQKLPEQIVEVEHQIVEQVKVQVPEVIEPVVVQEVKYELKQEQSEKPKAKQQKNRKKQEKSKKGKKGSKKAKQVPQVLEIVETIIPEVEKNAETQQPEIVIKTQSTTEEQQVPVEVQEVQQVQGSVSQQSDL